MNKKVILIFLILLQSLYISSVYGERDELIASDIVIILDDETLDLKEAPFIVNGRTLLPMRYIFEPLGLEVFWIEESKTAVGIKSDLKIELQIGSNVAMINGQAITLDVASKIINNRTYVPVRFIAESTGSQVGWNHETRTVIIKTEPLGYNKLSIRDLLVSIYANSKENKINYEDIRNGYHTIIRKIKTLSDENDEEEVKMKKSLYDLGNKVGISVHTSNSLQSILEAFNLQMRNYIKTTSATLKSHYPVYEYDNGDKYFGERLNGQLEGLGLYEFSSNNVLISELTHSNRSGIGVNIYDTGYQYANYFNNLVDGYQYSYYTYDESASINLSKYSNGIRDGKSYELRYDNMGRLLYSKFTNYENDKAIGLSEIEFADQTLRFDTASSDVNDVVLRIDKNGEYFILPTDSKGQSTKSRTGFGFKRFASGVEYIGEFFEESRLADGHYYASDDGSNIKTNLMDQMANEIIEKVIHENQSEDEKIKALHDYLAEHVLYDTGEEFKALSHTAYGALVDGVAVCDGYSEAFKYLLEKVAIEAIIVFGEAYDDGSDFTYTENHAWNLLKLEDGFYHYDLTWNDDDLNNTIHYDYYKKKAAFFEDTHWWLRDDYSDFIWN